VHGAPPPLELLLVGGRTVVERDHAVTVDEHRVADADHRASESLAVQLVILVSCSLSGIGSPAASRPNKASRQPLIPYRQIFLYKEY